MSEIAIYRQLCRPASTNSPHRARERRDALKCLDPWLATFVAPERGVSHESGNATVRIPILREDRDRDRPIHYCAHCLFATKSVGSLFSRGVQEVSAKTRRKSR